MKQFDIYLDETKTIYADSIPTFPDSKIWGNLSNKFAFILYRLDYDNRLLESIFEKINTYKENFKKRNGLNTRETSVVPFIEIIHVISDLRMITDEIIALLFILEKRSETGDYPDIIDIDQIGTLLDRLDKGEQTYLQFFQSYKDFLRLINDITNTYKHSFINDHVLFLRQLDVPTVFAIKSAKHKNRNKFDKNENKLISVTLENVVNDFNHMFLNYRTLVKQMANEQILKDYEGKRQL
ncbi:hypothetical protein [Flavobacterium sp. BFFFF1]|uniref:hypothetical protein n=1 Tax=Flavobacterium sp. BFFFF1 TaxID=2015557 RepID=UPI0025BEB49D|nr:hypothetical protein [Flavobacterium sp. BFFFF1]